MLQTFVINTFPESVDVAVVRGRLTFVPGSRLATIAIGITDDSIAEMDETFIVGLRALNETTINIDSTEVTIRDDDGTQAIFLCITISCCHNLQQLQYPLDNLLIQPVKEDKLPLGLENLVKPMKLCV